MIKLLNYEMYTILPIQNVYNNNNNNNNKSFKLKYTMESQKILIYNKVDKINKLNRAILNQQTKVNYCSLSEKCDINDQNTSIRKLILLKDLKNKWEKELLYMYFEEI